MDPAGHDGRTLSIVASIDVTFGEDQQNKRNRPCSTMIDIYASPFHCIFRFDDDAIEATQYGGPSVLD